MTICLPAEVQQWLHLSRIVVTEVDPELDATARSMVFGRLHQFYDTTDWIDSATTPILVRQCMSMFIAAWIYKRTYAESLPVNSENYAVRLENNAKNLLEQLATREILLIDDTDDPVATGSIAFFPTDTQEFDEQGNEIKFTMGMTF